MIIIFLFIFNPWFKSQNILTQQRNFYGIKQVISQGKVHSLISQSTLHGLQIMNNNGVDGDIAYYGATYPVIQQLHADHSSLHAMILGLGTGIMSCQFREQDKVSIVEIDKQIIDIARNNSYFTYLQDCPPQISIIEADGRIAVANEVDDSYDVLVIDVFNSDAIPIHLLTQEAFNLYAQKIKSDGAVLVNISNRHLNLIPVVTAAGRNNDMIVLHKLHSGNIKKAQLSSQWMLLTTNEKLAAKMMSKEGWKFVAESELLSWRDNYSNIIPILKY
jgi:spermidine synthase